MSHFGIRDLFASVFVLLICATTFQARAGGSGLNTVVIVNQNSPESCELGNYFCERRQVPPQNLLRINWAGGNITWSNTDFQTNLVIPLLNMLAQRQLTNQVDYVVLSMDIPFETVYDTNKVNSTTSALFYGLKDDTGPEWMGVTNSYAASEQSFPQAAPASAPGYSFLTTMLTAGSLAQAEHVVDQGVAGDSTFPPQSVVLAKSSDMSRNIRYHEFDNAIFDCRLRGNYSILRTNADSPFGQTNLLGYQTGLANFTVSTNTFVPGAMADSLTSFGGIIFGPNCQTTLLAFINAGAAGSYGTVTEPTASTQKFPNPLDYFYQARGFSLAESYYQSLSAPYQGIIVGEPLAAPFAQTASGGWTGVASNAVLSGTVQLGAAFAASDSNHPLQQIDLFVDGLHFETLTNCAPQTGNLLTVALNGYPLSYTVPTNATLATVASGLASLLNAPAVTNLTQVAAFAHGDRVELQLLATNGSAASFYCTDATTTNSAGRYYSAEYVPSLPPPQLTPMGLDTNGAFHVQASTASAQPYIVQASTNLTDWTALYTNSSGETVEVLDTQAAKSPSRFYRTLVLAQSPEPSVSSVQKSTNASGVLLKVNGAMQSCVILASTNQVQWTPVFTNLTVGQVDTAAGCSAGCAKALTTYLTASQGTFLDSAANGLRAFNVTGTISVGAWLRASVTKTNGVVIGLSVTNQSSTAALSDLAQQLITAINSSPDLQGSDGLLAEDLNTGAFGTACFNLCVRSPGCNAAALQVQLSSSAGVGTSPSASMSLNANLTDLLPRNHLYVTAGADNLSVGFLLDTTRLADGYHELAAVAYEGSDVRTQTRISLPIQIQNSPLSASLTLLDLANTASVQGTYHAQVVSNTNTVNLITLYSTGGALGTVTNQPTATFTIPGSVLGAGLHPIYAVVQAAGGSSYRTAVQSFRLTDP